MRLKKITSAFLSTSSIGTTKKAVLATFKPWPKPIIESVPILYSRLVKKIHVMQCKLGKLIEVGETLYLGVKFLFFLGFDDILLIVGGEDNCREVMTILRPRECVKDEIVWIVDDVVLRILWEFGL